MKTTLLLVLTMMSANMFAKDTILFIGGGGEPLDAKETQFDGSLEGMGEFYTNNKGAYDATVSFNGGHSKTEKKIGKYFSGNEVLPNFSAANYNKLIDDTIKKLSANPPEIRAGEKILIFINSHGSEKQGEKTHSISVAQSAMTNMNTGGASLVSLDKLKVLTDLAEKKNVRLGIIDGSCHAGNSLALANTKTCVIAGSGPNHYSYSDFAENFSKNMRKGRDLEEIFLETNTQVDGKGFPMISTPAGVAAQNELYPYLTPYMYYHDEYRGMSLDKIDEYLKTTQQSKELMCVRNRDYVRMGALVRLIENLSKVQKASGEMVETVDLSTLKKRIAEYKETQDEYLEQLNQLDLSNINKKESITSAGFKSPKNGFTHKELLSTDFDFLIENKKIALKNSSLSDSKREQAINLIEYYEAAIVARDRVLRENPQYVQQQKIMARLRKDSDASYKVATKIMKEANKAYNALYIIKKTETLKLRATPPNPCKDFVL